MLPLSRRGPLRATLAPGLAAATGGRYNHTVTTPEATRRLRGRRALEVLVVASATSALWFSALPRAPADWADIAMELAWLCAVAAGYMLLPRASVGLLEAGWRIVLFSLLLEVLDEFTLESAVLSEYLTGFLAIAGLLMLGVGVQRALRHEEHETEARQAAEARERQAREDIARANAALRDAVRNREDLVSIVSHDFRSPLTLIRGYAEVLQGRAQDDETRRLLGVIVQQAQHLATLAADTLTMSSIDAGTLPLQFTRLRVEDVARRVGLARGDRVSIEVAPEALAFETTADVNRLEQVLQNLVDNALKYSPATAPVTVRLEREDDALRVSVRDEGRGIAPAEVPLLFQKFSRLPGARQDGISGTGLGLYICRSIVEGHGGRIWVESAPGRGSTFHVLLPPASDLA